MGGEGQHRRLSAILAADVAGYTRLVEQDKEGTVAAWQTAQQLSKLRLIAPNRRWKSIPDAARPIPLSGMGKSFNTATTKR